MKPHLIWVPILAAGVVAISVGLPNAWAQTKVPRIGVLTAGVPTEQPTARYLEILRRGLAKQGWIEGRTASLELRGGKPAKFAEGAAELVGLKVDVIYAVGAGAVRAVSAATREIPIVGVDFTTDPLAAGYAKSYGRPGGNITGIFLDAPDFSAKWLELLRGIVPKLSRVAVVRDPSVGDTHLRALQSTAPSVGVQLQVVEVRTPEDIDAAASAFRGDPQALIVLPSPMIYVESPRLVKLTMKPRLPATSMAIHFAEAGGLLAYGPDDDAVVERVAVLVAKILGGASPGDLPIERPAKFELVVNLKAAKALNLTIPDAVLARADRVVR
jgi:putative ABC transport system substrate-binding protein